MIRLAALVLMTVSPLMPVRAAGDMDLATFLVVYRCDVIARIQDLYRDHDPAMAQHRWLSIERDGADQAYVQCMFDDDARQMWCEAASGYYFTKPDQPRKLWLSLPAKVSLAALGFDTSIENGNYPRYIPTLNAADLNAAADLLLSALYLAYGARDKTPISLTSQKQPLAHLKPCAPVS